ncbi:MAG TPA: site-specific integrase [Blastocatellia bacterium]|nr:site-specific integrase [Blastocatellia bacterium]
MPVYKRNPQGNIVKDNEPGCWFYDFVIEGRRYKKALQGIRTRSQAEKIEEKKRFAVFSGDEANKLGNTIFKQFVEEIYLPYQKLRIRSYRKCELCCRLACRFFKDKTMRDLENDPNLIERFMYSRLNGRTKRGGNRNPNTVNREMALLSGIFTLAVRRRYCKSNPCKGIGRLPVANARRTAVFTPEDEERLLNALSGNKEKYRPIVILGLYTGMRLSEVLGLKREWIDLNQRELALPGSLTKNRKSRTIQLNQEALNALVMALQAHQDAKWVFPKTPGSGFTVGHISQVISKACDQIGLPDATMHATRRTFNTRLIERNINPLHVKELMGHSRVDMTDHYTNLSRESLREAVKTLETKGNSTDSVPQQ